MHGVAVIPAVTTILAMPLCLGKQFFGVAARLPMILSSQCGLAENAERVIANRRLDSHCPLKHLEGFSGVLLSILRGTLPRASHLQVALPNQKFRIIWL
jgi:hypothetical protein